MKKYYLVAQYNPQRGQSLEDPACRFCGGYFAPKPLADVDRTKCYTSLKRAQNVAIKRGAAGWRWGWRCEVIEVPEEALRPE